MPFRISRTHRFLLAAGLARLILLILFGESALYNYLFDCLINQNTLFFKECFTDYSVSLITVFH